MKAALILIPVAFALLRMFTGRYVFSALTTLACAAIALPTAPVMAAALFASFAGDWFMAHKGSNEKLYLGGIAGFFVGHALFIAHALMKVTFAIHAALILGRDVQPLPIRGSLIAGATLAVAIAVYLARTMKKVPRMLRIPVALYALISVVGLTCALATGDVLYSAGIASLLFSDLMIAESDFACNPKTGWLILPTYYLCHILVALSAMI